MNKLELSGVVIGIEPLRYTPAGLPLLSFIVSHASESTEAGMRRKVVCEINAIAMGDLATSNIALGVHINVAGFLAKRSAKSTQLALHIQKLEILKNI